VEHWCWSYTKQDYSGVLFTCYSWVTCHMVMLSQAHLVSQVVTGEYTRKRAAVITCMPDRYHPETCRNTDSIITASEQTPKHTQCHVVSATASDLVDMWSLLRPISLQLHELFRPSNYYTVTARMYIRRGNIKTTLHTTWLSCSMCIHTVTNNICGPQPWWSKQAIDW